MASRTEIRQRLQGVERDLMKLAESFQEFQGNRPYYKLAWLSVEAAMVSVGFAIHYMRPRKENGQKKEEE